MKEKSNDNKDIVKSTTTSSEVTPKPILHHEISDTGSNTEFNYTVFFKGVDASWSHSTPTSGALNVSSQSSPVSSPVSNPINTTTHVETTALTSSAAPSSSQELVETLLAGSTYCEEHEA